MSESGSWRTRLTGTQYLGWMALITAIAVAIGVMLSSDSDRTPFIVAAGVLGSLIASFMALGFTLVIADATGRAATAQRLEQAVDGLAASAPLLQQGPQYGIRALKPKQSYGTDEWTALLTGARERLFIVGHALDKWCREEVHDDFVAAIRRLVLDGKRVDLIVLSVTAERVGEQRGVEYGRRIRHTLEVLRGVAEAIPPEKRARLDVRTLDEDATMPYMVAGNEQELITAAYPGAAQDSGKMLAIRVDTETPFGYAILEDLRCLKERYSTAVPLN